MQTFSKNHVRLPGISRKISVFFSIMLILTALPVFNWQPRTANAASDVSYFAITGHYMSGAFKTYWESYGGLEQFGYPLTEPFYQQSTNGATYVTQYFERAIFEYHPENAGTKYQVLLRLVGHDLTTGRENEGPFKAIAPFASNSDRNFYSQTGHSLAFGFKGYWEKYGGLAQFGYPISEEFTELNPADGKTYTVQYFERARFEYHPEFKGTKYEVLLGLLGWQQMEKVNLRQDVRAKQPAGLDDQLGGIGPNGAPKVQAVFGSGPATNPTPTNNPLQGPHIGYGMNVWLFGTDKQRVLDMVKGAGFNWVRQQVGWDTLEPAPGQFNWDELDQIVDAVNRNNIHIIMSIVRSPSWAGINGTNGLPANPATFGDLMRQMAARYKGRVDSYEMWNEQNLARETAGRVQVAPYVETLKAGYTGVKASDPSAIVLFGGLSPTGIVDPSYAIDDVKFLEMCYQYNNGEIRNYFDVLGAHPGGAANSPDEFYPIDRPADPNRPWSTHPSFYFRRVENIRDVMVKYGDANKQIWLTEFGWTTKNQAPGYEYGALVSDQQQADYLVRAYQRAKTNYPWMGVMAMWNLNFATVVGPADEKAPWGIINSDWSTRPAYEALKAMPK
ncbi:MAG TPA: cellulase family glycosylhydrolase [Chloroflexia bacterium]|nr:cellulase family glycosylhydrolase [Chloroflexia bacterium]